MSEASWVTGSEADQRLTVIQTHFISLHYCFACYMVGLNQNTHLAACTELRSLGLKTFGVSGEERRATDVVQFEEQH